MVAGSPCDPYSVMRQKRFHEDSVMQHRDYSTMFSSVLGMISKYLPSITILEQVLGFDQKFHAASPETPYQRPLLLQLLHRNYNWQLQLHSST